ncbi:MAG TPA: DUF1990 domain-containing protein [Propionibacteriaceae bacterium]
MTWGALNYPEVGATLGELPSGYRTVVAGRPLGGEAGCFDNAVACLLGWEMHRRAGLTVRVDGPVAAGVDAVLGVGVGPLRIRAPVRVVYVIDEPDARGFAYGTLPGHPEIGEELFVVRRDPDGTVHAQIRAFSRPGSHLTRLGGPVVRWVQDAITQRYLDSLCDIVLRSRGRNSHGDTEAGA